MGFWVSDSFSLSLMKPRNWCRRKWLGGDEAWTSFRYQILRWDVTCDDLKRSLMNRVFGVFISLSVIKDATWLPLHLPHQSWTLSNFCFGQELFLLFFISTFINIKQKSNQFITWFLDSALSIQPNTKLIDSISKVSKLGALQVCNCEILI